MRALTLFGTLMIAALGAAPPACADDSEIIGTVLGASVGGLFGSQIGRGSGQLVATGLGVAVGGAIGNSIGHDMDRESSRAAGTSFVSPPSGDDYAPIVYAPTEPNYVAPPAPPPTYIDQDAGTYCRPYSQEIRIDGQLQESYGTACLQPDGTWRIVQ